MDIWFGGTLKSMLYFSNLPFVSVISNLKFHPLHRHRISSGHERGKRLYLFISFYSFFFFSGSVFYFKNLDGCRSKFVCHAFILYDTDLPPYALPATCFLKYCLVRICMYIPLSRLRLVTIFFYYSLFSFL